MFLVFIRPPGAGKGTQSKRLLDYLRIPHFSTGEMLRDAKDHDTDIGRLAAKYMDNGSLVPDDVVMKMVLERLDKPEFVAQFAIIIGAGSANFRRTLSLKVLSHGGILATVVHPTAVISRSAKIGDGSFLAANAVVGVNAIVGRFTIVNTGATIDHDNVIADGVNIERGRVTKRAGDVTLGLETHALDTARRAGNQPRRGSP